MPMNAQGLELDEQGQVKLSPLIGWTAFVGYKIGCCVRLDFAPSLDDLERPEAVQLVMTPEQARQLGEALLTKADQVSKPA